MLQLTLAFLLLGVLAVFAANPHNGVSLDSRKLGVKFDGNSSHISFYQRNEDGSLNKNFYKFMFEEIEETDKNGRVVNKVSTLNGPRTDWSAVRVTDEFVNVNLTAADVQVAGQTVSFLLEYYLYNETVQVKNGNETVEVRRDSFKWTISIGNWPFASEENSLSFHIKMAGSGNGKQSIDVKKDNDKVESVTVSGDGDSDFYMTNNNNNNNSDNNDDVADDEDASSGTANEAQDENTDENEDENVDENAAETANENEDAEEESTEDTSDNTTEREEEEEAQVPTTAEDTQDNNNSNKDNDTNNNHNNNNDNNNVETSAEQEEESEETASSNGDAEGDVDSNNNTNNAEDNNTDEVTDSNDDEEGNADNNNDNNNDNDSDNTNNIDDNNNTPDEENKNDNNNNNENDKNDDVVDNEKGNEEPEQQDNEGDNQNNDNNDNQNNNNDNDDDEYGGVGDGKVNNKVPSLPNGNKNANDEDQTSEPVAASSTNPYTILLVIAVSIGLVGWYKRRSVVNATVAASPLLPRTRPGNYHNGSRNSFSPPPTPLTSHPNAAPKGYGNSHTAIDIHQDDGASNRGWKKAKMDWSDSDVDTTVGVGSTTVNAAITSNKHSDWNNNEWDDDWGSEDWSNKSDDWNEDNQTSEERDEDWGNEWGKK